jgi:hypothetical protein
MPIYLGFCSAADREASLGYSFAEVPKGRRLGDTLSDHRLWTRCAGWI